MTEPIFQIISKKRKNVHKHQPQSSNSYNNLVQEYLSRSYGYYTELFLKKITQKIQSQYQNLRKFQLRKIFRQIVTKYLMSDLQVIFMIYFSNLHQWNYNHEVIEQIIQKNNDSNIDLNQINKFKLFLNLVCFFVKSYIGSKDELMALIDMYNQKLPEFNQIYGKWKQNNERKLFQISPRELNAIYSDYSKNCGQRIYKKDYNNMVDKILDLSTTYSMMPTKQKDPLSQKKEKKSSKHSKQLLKQQKSQQYLERQYDYNQVLGSSRKRSMRNFQSNLIDNASFKWDLSDWRSNKKQSIIVMPGNNSKISLGEKINQKQKQRLSSIFIDSSINQRQKPDFVKCAQPSNQASNNGPKKISLNKKKKQSNEEVNNFTKSFFGGKDVGMSIDDMRKNQSNMKDIVPSNFLDLNSNSDKIESIPFNYRNNSNIFGPSTLF